jgi:hypothetical protein
MKPISALTHGDHACLLYTNRKAQVAAVVDFLKLGFPKNERCFFLGDPETVERVRASLQSAGVNVDEELRNESLVLSSDRSFLTHGTFNGERMLFFLQQAEADAKKAGFSGLRATGDIIWQMGPHLDFRIFLDYEKLLDAFLKKSNVVGLCQYHTASVPVNYLEEAIRNHPHSASA